MDQYPAAAFQQPEFFQKRASIRRQPCRAAIFTALLPAQIPTAFYYIVPLMSFLIDVSWYSLVALVLSADRPRRVYLRLKRRIDIATATVLGALGLRLIATSLTR